MPMYRSDSGMIGLYNPALGKEWLSVYAINGVVLMSISDINDPESNPEWFAMDAEMVSHLSDYLLEWQIKNTIGE